MAELTAAKPKPSPASAVPQSAPPLPASGPHAPSDARDADDVTLHTDLLGDLVVPGAAGRAAELQALSQRGAVYAARGAAAPAGSTAPLGAATSPGARRWAASRSPATPGCSPCTPPTADAGVAVSTLRVDLAAIRTAHLLAGVALDLRHPRPRHPPGPPGRPCGARHAAPTAGRCPLAGSALGARDRAMLLGFGAALRRSELVALQLGEVTPVPGRGLRVLVRRSKTDQHGHGQKVAVCANPVESLLCLVLALDAWLAHRHRAADLDWTAVAGSRPRRPLFCAVTKAGLPTGAMLSDKALTRLNKATAARAGFEPFGGRPATVVSAFAQQHGDPPAPAPARSTCSFPTPSPRGATICGRSASCAS